MALLCSMGWQNNDNPQFQAAKDSAEYVATMPEVTAEEPQGRQVKLCKSMLVACGYVLAPAAHLQADELDVARTLLLVVALRAIPRQLVLVLGDLLLLVRVLLHRLPLLLPPHPLLLLQQQQTTRVAASRREQSEQLPARLCFDSAPCAGCQ